MKTVKSTMAGSSAARQRGFGESVGNPAAAGSPKRFAWLGPLTCVAFFTALSLLAQPAPKPGAGQTRAADSCVQCHTSLDEALGHQMEGDIHLEKGLGCVGCHGGDATQADQELAMSAAAGFAGKPKPAQVPAFCGKCHSDADFMKRYNPALRIDQQAEYLTSVHGKLLSQGDQTVATCVSCHGSHGIRPVNHPMSRVYPPSVAQTCGKCHADPGYMKARLPTDQVARYEKSVHAEALMKKNDLSAPTCNDCHGTHGASPPGVSSVANVCGTCHTRQAEMFRLSPHNESFQQLGQAECLVCHENHQIASPTDRMLGSKEPAICASCHSEGDRGAIAADAMSRSIATLANQLSEAEKLVSRAERAGMEVSRARFGLSEGHDALVSARVVVHRFSPAHVKSETDRGMSIARKTYQMGQQALEELQFRRKGLAASLLVIGLALVALYFKIRQIERAKK
ncbi:MAG: cytochrome c3 family protein [Acidobacteriota bacterium]